MTSTKDGKFTVYTSGKTVTLITPSGEEIELMWYEASDLSNVLDKARGEAKPSDIDTRIEDLRNTPYGRP